MSAQPTAAATISQALRSGLRTVIFMFTPWVAERAKRALTRTSCPPRYTPASRRVCEDLSGSTLSDRSHGCIPMKLVICFTASESGKKRERGREEGERGEREGEREREEEKRERGREGERGKKGEREKEKREK